MINIPSFPPGRRFHAFCIGSGKTGTTTVAKMFSKYRSCHEPLAALANELVLQIDKGDIIPSRAVELFQARDQVLSLEMESSWPLGMIPAILAAAFPQAKCIVTIRNPVTWLRSRVKYHYHVRPDAWQRLRAHFWYNKNYNPRDYQAEDSSLIELGLSSVKQYLRSYEEQYLRIMSGIPADRKWYIRTEDLSSPDHIAGMAAFMEVAPESLVQAVENTSSGFSDPTSLISDQWLHEQARLHCPQAYQLWELSA